MAKTFWITTDMLGTGDERLGRVLMRNFLYSLARNADAPARVMLVNGGVRLACEGSESLDDLRLLGEGLRDVSRLPRPEGVPRRR
jgi:hypothetical protein